MKVDISLYIFFDLFIFYKPEDPVSIEPAFPATQNLPHCPYSKICLPPDIISKSNTKPSSFPNLELNRFYTSSVEFSNQNRHKSWKLQEYALKLHMHEKRQSV